MPQGRVYKHTLCLYANLAQSISQVPNFPKDPSPSGLALFWKIGKWKWLEVHISQFPKRRQPIWLSTIWEVWKQAKDTDFPVSQMIPAQMTQDYLGNWEIGKWLEVQISQFPNFPDGPSPDGSGLFGKLGNWEMAGGTYFPISQKTPAQMAQHYLGNWEPLTLNSCSLNP